MQIKNIEVKDVKPCENSIFPCLIFEVDINYTKYQEAIIGVSGWLQTDDGKIIAEIKEAIRERGVSDELGAHMSELDSEFKEGLYKTTLIALLDEKALDYIEKRRLEDRKGNVKLTLNLNVKCIESKALVFHLHEVDPESIGLPPISIQTRMGGKSQGKIIVYAYDQKFYRDEANKWILSGHRGPIFLSTKEESIKGESLISSSDWIHDFAPKLGLGEYFVVEIPTGKKTIEKAWEYIKKAEECFRTWDTKGVYANCRETGTLLDGIVNDKFRDKPTIKKWRRAIGKFNYSASLDLHTEEIINKERPEGEVKVGKADAEYILIVTKALVKYAEELIQEG